MPGTLLRAALALALLAGAAAPGAAQEWRGTGRAHGVVVDHQGEPVAGARVTLAPAEVPGPGPEPVATDRKGRWSLGGLAPGRWRLTVEAPGQVTAEGWVEVAAAGPGRSTRVELRPLAEGTPAFSEGGPSTVLRWLERGNSLLSQGRPGEARAEYEKALAALPPAEHPEILRAVARTHFLQGDLEAAETALQRALVIDPDDADSRQLFRALLAELGRDEEAGRWLALLDAEGPEAAAPDLLPLEAAEEAAPRVALEERPVLAPEPGRRGRFRTAFTAPSGLAAPAVLRDKYSLGTDEVEALGPAIESYDLAGETFEVYVPDGYRPEEPHGLLVWVSPTPNGGASRPETLEVLAERRLIWVGANRAGNRRAAWDRLALALDAAHNMQRLYAVDPARVYVAGYSGGGRMASSLGFFFPEVFGGAFSLFGCDYFQPVPVPDKPGTHWAARLPEPPRRLLGEIREHSRFVLLTGERDFNRAQTKAYYERMQKDGFRHLTYLEVPGADHYSGVPKEWFARGIAALDGLLASPR